MIHTCCPTCRLRFGPATAAYLTACPQCGQPPQAMAGAGATIGLRLFIPETYSDASMPEAVAVALPIPGLTAPPRG